MDNIWDKYKQKQDNSGQSIAYLPFSPKCVVELKRYGGGTIYKNHWNIVQTSLLHGFSSSLDLQNAIKNYNIRIGNFTSLHKFCDQLNENKRKYFFEQILPNIVNLALRLPEIVRSHYIILLRQNENNDISFTEEEVASLLANAFLCTFPSRKSDNKYSEINFNKLFECEGSSMIVEKIKCIVNYFIRVCTDPSQRFIKFERRSECEFPNWSKLKSELSLTSFKLCSEGTIEDKGTGCLQIDFANKYVGGGVLGRGCVQEEILFLIFPELIISKLFTEYLMDNEALIIIGAKRFNNYSGYSSSFKFQGNNDEITTSVDNHKRLSSYIVAIDAKQYPEPTLQYEQFWIDRELNKAYVGFSALSGTSLSGIASGNWGCGAFGGDPKLKSLIQLMACCAVTGKYLLYFTFGNETLKDDLEEINMFLRENKITIKKLYKYLINYKDHHQNNENLYKFIKRAHSENEKRFPGLPNYLRIFSPSEKVNKNDESACEQIENQQENFSSSSKDSLAQSQRKQDFQSSYFS